MLGIILIYFIGKQFFELAITYQKSKWPYAIAGVVSYYVGTFIAGIGIAIFMEYNRTGSIDEMNDFVLNLIALPFGLVCCYGLYKLLERNWKLNLSQSNPDVLDQNI